ncbi:M13-type metalloendopeptidase, partial [Lactobacillus acetotolerans]
DKDGNLADWWTAEDAKNFDARAQVMVDFFDNIDKTFSTITNNL